jgi:hypothetical protein
VGKDWQGTGLIDVAYAVRICLERQRKIIKKLGMCPVSWPGTSIQHSWNVAYIDLLAAVNTKFEYGGKMYCL